MAIPGGDNGSKSLASSTNNSSIFVSNFSNNLTEAEYPGLSGHNSKNVRDYGLNKTSWFSFNRLKPRFESEAVLQQNPKAVSFTSAAIEHDRVLPVPRSSHRIGAQTAALAALTCLIINVALVIWLGKHPYDHSVLVTVYRGSCKRMKEMSVGLHLLINALSTLLLAGSNYCMQCLCAPTRQDIDRSHRKGRYLNIGTQSIGNLLGVARYKVILWWILLVSSLPIHLFYNAAFYPSIAVQDYPIYVVTDEFVSGAPVAMYNITWGYRYMTNYSTEDQASLRVNLTHLQSDIRVNTTWQTLTPRECIRAYAQEMITDRGRLLVVSKESDQYGNNVLNLTTYTHTFSDISAYDWICRSMDPLSITYCSARLPEIVDRADEWVVYGHHVDHCLSERTPEFCSLNGNLIILIIVILCNAVKASVMLFVAYRRLENPLITVGDGIQSFLEEPDTTTKDLCWMTKADVVKSKKLRKRMPISEVEIPWPAGNSSGQSLQAVESKRPPGQQIELHELRWRKAAERYQWYWMAVPLITGIIITLGLLSYGLAVLGRVADGRNYFSVGFGRISLMTLIASWGVAYQRSPDRLITSLTLISNCPQLLLSCIYYSLNGIVTAMYSAHEWSAFAATRKYLRVSSPRGRQRSTYYLSLPYQIGIPFMIYFGVFHWIISQSFYPAVLSERSSDGSTLDALAIATCGFSLVGLLVIAIMGIILVIFVTTIGVFGKLDRRARLVAGCSAAISASCHGPCWDTDAALKRIKYGALPKGLAEQHVVQKRFVYRWNEVHSWNEIDRNTDETRSSSLEETIRSRSDDLDLLDIGHLCFTSGEVEDPKEDVLYS